MTSPARVQANRENAGKSTGPRTPEGKAKSSRNARRHGLNGGTPADYSDRESQLQASLRLHVRNIGPARVAPAAQALVLIERVRAAQIRVLEAAFRVAETRGLGAEALTRDELVALSVLRSSSELLRLQTYERKARSRARRAVFGARGVGETNPTSPSKVTARCDPRPARRMED